MKKYSQTILLFLSFSITYAQNKTLSGKILDQQTHEPLAFVSIGIEGTRLGTVSDIDGKFLLTASPNAVLKISYIGYESKRILVSDLPSKTTIYIQQKSTELSEVVIRPSANPAHRIILLAIQNKAINDPERYDAFKYNSYTIAGVGATNKNIKPADPEKLKKYREERAKKAKPQKSNPEKGIEEDSLVKEWAKGIMNNYMFVNETITQREFRKPNLSKETVMATKTSGLNKSPLALVPSIFQPFGFYKDSYTMTDTRTYQSPLTNGAIRQYDFELLDTLVHERDSTFIISFMPKIGKNFEGLKGLLYINSDRYAIENVIAEPAELKDRKMAFKMQQMYERVQGKWFPRQLNTEIKLNQIAENKRFGSVDSVSSSWATRSYIYNIDFQKDTKTKFDDFAQEIDDEARTKSADYWQKSRPDTLDSKAEKTYEAYEKLPNRVKKELNTQVEKFTTILTASAIPLGKNFEIPFASLFPNVSTYEGFRLGVGLRTSAGFSKKIIFEGNVGYGFGDKALKYGLAAQLNLNKTQTTFLKIGYKQDIDEPASTQNTFLGQTPNFLGGDNFRQFLASRMDSIRLWRAEFGFRPIRRTQMFFWLQSENRNPAKYDYLFQNQDLRLMQNYTNTSLGLTFRLSSNEKLSRNGTRIFANELPKRLFLLQLSKGLNGINNGQFDYTKLQVQYTQSLKIRQLGQTTLRLDAAQVWGNVPYSYLFNGNGSNSGKLSVIIPKSFQTMGLYEFLSDKYANIVVAHNFGQLLFRTDAKYSRPELSLHYGYAIGKLDNPLTHKNLTFKTLEKGYQETGISVNNLLRFDVQSYYLGLGVGGFYRFGANALAENSKNWALRMGISISF